MSYVSACLAACAVTNVELLYRNQRHPFHDKRMKAVGWWVSVVAIDVLIAGALVAGLIQTNLIQPPTVTNSQVWVTGFLTGLLGPLALRSPIRKKQINEQEVSVGITYVYDIVRLNALYALDERLVRLRRRDVSELRESWKAKGIDPDAIATEIRLHLDDHARLPNESKDRIIDQITNVMTLPYEDDRIDGLIKILRAERFKSLMDDFNASTHFYPVDVNIAKVAMLPKSDGVG
jgi:hypothetical protein